MSNEYFTAALIARFTRIRSNSINAIATALEAAFDLIPDGAKLRSDSTTYVDDVSTIDNVYVAVLDPAIAAYTDGLTIKLAVNRTNTGPATLDMNGLGPRTIKRPSNFDTVAGDLTDGRVATLTYRGGSFYLTSATSADALAVGNFASQAAASATAAAQSLTDTVAALGTTLKKAANLSDLTDVVAARANLGLGSAALLASTVFMRTDQANSFIRFGSETATNNDRVVYDEAANSYNWFADQALSAVPFFKFARGDGVYFEGNKVWHAGNHGPSSGLNADLLDGIQGTDYARANTITNGFIWASRNSTSATLLTTQQGTGSIAQFRSGSGNGTTKLQVNNDGSLGFFGGTGQALLRDSAGTPVIAQISAGGGFAFGADDSTLISCGEAGTTLQANLNLNSASEEMYFASDNSFYWYSNLQGGWGDRVEMKFGDDGVLTVPNLTSTTFTTVNQIVSSTGDLSINASGSVRPLANGVTSLGSSTRRWQDVWSVDGTINTSDETQKEQVEDLTAAELEIALILADNIKKFKWKSAVQEKGAGARTHTGVMAQFVESTFLAKGLDAGNYGMFMKDEILDEQGVGTGDWVYGIRPDELKYFMTIGIRQNQILLEQRIAVLEQSN